MDTTRTLTLKIAGLALLTTLALAGCGGGGGNSGGGNKTLAGTLLGVGNAPLTGYRVVYDPGTAGAQTATTDGNGQYKFLLSPSSVTGADTLSFYDAAGHLVDQQSVTIPAGQPAIAITTVVPPTPPPGV